MGMQKMGSDDYVIRICEQPGQVNAADWDGLLAAQSQPTPFLRHAYLAALHHSGSATTATGWTPRWITLWRGPHLAAACPLYLKQHSYGEYVFDWAWAEAYARHGLAFYPKAVVAVPFTPVPGTRLMADSPQARDALLQALLRECRSLGVSSLHLLFAADDDLAASEAAGLMQRDTVQFHWSNRAPTLATSCASLPPEGAPFALGRPGGESDVGRPFASFDAFLASLAQDKRKKIRQERRKVAEAGVRFRWARGADITAADWDFFYRCYERTYLEHGNPPYLSRDFFARMARDLPQAWLLFVGEREGRPIASSLIAIQDHLTLGIGPKNLKNGPNRPPAIAYGRYWGALERVDCLHFEACYYQPLEWCITHGVARFEGGAQGEHKMARALLPVRASSAHWLAHPGFADAVERFLAREGDGVAAYLDDLAARSPLRKSAAG